MPGPCLSAPSFSVVESTVLLLQTSDKDNSSEKPLFYINMTPHFLFKPSKRFQNHFLPHHEDVSLTNIIIFM